MALEKFADYVSTTVSSGGTTSPAGGTVETWTVASSAGFPAASSTGTPPIQFHVADVANPAESILVTNISGTTWTVTRGDEGTTPFSHTAGFTIKLVVTKGGLEQAARVDWLNAATMFSADTAGVTDATSAIQNALNAATAGQVVYLPAGVYKVSSPITIPSRVMLKGDGGYDRLQSGVDAGSLLRPTSAFSGTEVLYFADNATAAVHGGGVSGIGIDGSSYTAAALDGIRGFGPVLRVLVENVAIASMSGWGINTTQDAGAGTIKYPYWWTVRHVILDQCASGGLSLTNMTDATFTDVYVLSCGKGLTPGPGWSLTSPANSMFTNCRGEWCGTNGWHLTGVWNNGTGSGGAVFTGCSTDRNEQDGVLIDATGQGPVAFAGLMCRRDGRNAKTGGGSYSGLKAVSTTIPIAISSMTVLPGVDDDGTGTNSPQYGVTGTGLGNFSIESGYIQGASTTFNLDFSGLTWIGGGVVGATGTPAAAANVFGQQFRAGIYADVNTYGGNIDLHNAGTGIKVAEGSNAKQGVATLAAGTVTVSNTSVTANSRIFLTSNTDGGTPGWLRVSARTAGASFTITSSSGTDTSTVAYEIYEPG